MYDTTGAKILQYLTIFLSGDMMQLKLYEFSVGSGSGDVWARMLSDAARINSRLDGQTEHCTESMPLL